MVHRLNRLRRQDDGAIALVVVLLTSMVFIGLCALVVNLGMARDTRRQAQNAADASALAAGNVLYANGSVNINGAIAAARSYATKNYGVSTEDWAACTDSSALAYPDPNSACISFDSTTAPTTVRVNVPVRQVPTPFAGIWGVSSVPVAASARIQLRGGLAACGLCVIGSGTHNLQVGSITINGASVAINGTLRANNAHGSITVTGTSTDGTAMGISLQGTTPGTGTFSPTPLQNQPAIVDPLASLTMPNYTDPLMPNYSALTVHANTNTCPGVPGIYDHLSACGGIGMTAGLYVLTGSTGGNFGIVAHEVTLDLVCGTYAAPRACNVGESGASLGFTGSATSYLDITGPAAGLNQGLAIVADRNNTATLAFGGNGAANTGTIYAASGTLAYNGNGGLGTDSLIVVRDFSFSGSPSAFVSSYTQVNNVTVPPSGLHLSQ